MSNSFFPEVQFFTLFCCFFTETADRSPGGFPPFLPGLHFQFGMDRCQMQSLLLGKLVQLKLPVIFWSELLLPCTTYSPFLLALALLQASHCSFASSSCLSALLQAHRSSSCARTSHVWGQELLLLRIEEA